MRAEETAKRVRANRAAKDAPYYCVPIATEFGTDFLWFLAEEIDKQNDDQLVNLCAAKIRNAERALKRELR